MIRSIPSGFPQQGFVLNIVVYPAKLSTLQLFEHNETVMKGTVAGNPA